MEDQAVSLQGITQHNGVQQVAHATSSALENAVQRGQRPLQKRRRKRIKLAPYLFILPFVLFFLILFVGPTIYSLILSFYRYRGYGAAVFVGWQNYNALWQYGVFWSELRNTIFYWLVHVIPMMALAFLLALLVRSKLAAWPTFLKPVLFLPNVMAIVAASLVFQSFFGTDYGVMNQLLHIKVDWLHNYAITRYVVVALVLWRNTGWWFIVFLVGLTSINPDLEEAAHIDGATLWQRLRFIILPLMRNTFLFAFVIDAIGSMRIFTEPNVLLAGGGSMANPEVAPLLNMLVDNLNNGNFGQAAAVGWVFFLLGIVAAVIQFRVFRGSEEVE